MQIQNLKKFFKKRYIFAVIFLIIIVFVSIKNRNSNKDFLVENVKRQDLIQSVLATGQVVSDTDLDLSFNSSGIVKSINVKVGDKVQKGKVLASLDQGSLLASLTQAQGSLLAAQAKYQKTLEGSTLPEIALAKILLENAKRDYENIKSEQDAIVEKALNDFWRSGLNENLVGVKDEYTVLKKARDTAVASAKALVDQRQAELDIKIASATDSDISLAKADILSAEGQVKLAESNLGNSMIIAPTSGTVTKVDIKLGELAEANKKSITIEDVENLYIEAKINEANISFIKLNDPVSIVYDALGPEKVFYGSVFSIDPSSTTEDGVVNYKVKISLDPENINQIRPGMNADITIITLEKKDVLVVPVLSTINRDGQYFIKKLRDQKKKSYEEIPVKVGDKGDGNLIEILEGINEGDRVVVNTK